MKQLILLCLIMLQVVTTWGEEKSDAIPYGKKINVYWTNTPPLLDGKLDDACWKDAEIAKEFRSIFNKKPAASKTEVRMCYDAQYLYFFYFMHDDKIEKLKVGTPDDARDVMDVNKDVLELFIDPKRSKKAYFQFMTSPLGARFDLRITPEGKREMGLYTPEWKVVPVIGKDHWAVEFRIPFSELVFDGGFIGTPQPGEKWGINFCRDRGYRKEWAHWSPHKSKSFHRPAEFGVAVFRGRRNGTLPIFNWKTQVKLDFGPGEIGLNVKPAQKNLSGEWSLIHNRKPTPTVGTPVGKEKLSFRYHIISGGRWDVQTKVKQNSKIVFYGRGVSQLPPIKELLVNIVNIVSPGLEKVKKTENSQGIKALAQKLQELKQLIDPLEAKIKVPEKLSQGQWGELVKAMPVVKAKWQPLKYDLEMLRYFKDQGNKEPLFSVGIAGAYQRIFPDTVLVPQEKPIKIWGAGRERESFQIVLMPFWQDVQNVNISFSDLQGDAGKIPASCFEYSIVGFVKMHQAWGGKWTPDVLYPGKAFDLRKNHTQPIWVDLHIPAGTKAGIYRGEVKVSADGQMVKVPVVLHAFGFDIPKKRSVSTDPWYWPSEMKKYYKVKRIVFTPELYEKHLKVLSKYRYACYPLDTLGMWFLLKMYKEENGSLTFDFSGWDRIFELGEQYGADNLGASFGCNFNALRPTFSGRLPIYDRKTGKKVSTPAQYAWNMAKWKYVHKKTSKSDFAANPVYRQYIAQFVEYLRKRGLLKNSHYEIYDEPKTLVEWRDVLRMHGFLKKFVPDLKLKSYGVDPWKYEDIPEYRPFGYYDVWAPGLYTLTPKRVETLHDRRQKGEEFWFYTCSAGYRDSDRKSNPHICLYQHPLAPRMHGWASWKLKADGFLIFALMAGNPKNVQIDQSKYYTHPIWHASRTAAQGYLVYPGPDQELIPSIRLAAVRDGLEDYEYFKVLNDKLKKLDPIKDAALIKSIKTELKVGDEIMPWDWREWTRDVKIIGQKRKRLAGLISSADKKIAAKKQ